MSFTIRGCDVSSREKLFFGVALTWSVIGVLSTPVVEIIMVNSGFFVMRSIFPSWFYLLLFVILAVPIVLLLQKAGSIFNRSITCIPFVFHSFPALALLAQPDLYIMFFPVGIYAFLCSPLNPLFILPEFRWLLTGIVPDHGLRVLFLSGMCLSAIGLVIFIIAFIQFLRHKGFITSGLYSVVRHPQYFGIILSTLGLTLFQYNLRLITAISWIIVAVSYGWLARREEASLKEEYGENFVAYTRRVPFMLPFPRAK